MRKATSRRRLFLATGLLWTASMIGSLAQGVAPAPVAGGADTPDYQAVVGKYCVTCHNDRTKVGGFSLDRLNVADLGQDAERWEKVLRKLNTGAMPPQGMPRPDKTTYDGMIAWAESRIDQAAAAKPDPGRALLRRLNRTEYANAVRDLLALDVDVSSLLPADNSSYGFDNVADVLGVSPVLLERYLAAAGRISRLAVGSPSIAASEDTYRAGGNLTQDRHIDGLPLGTVGGMRVDHYFPLDGEYVIKAKLWGNSLDFIRGLEHENQLEIAIDGERVLLAPFGGKADMDALFDNQTALANVLQNRFTVRLALTAGRHAVTVAFLHKSAPLTVEHLEAFENKNFDPIDFVGLPHLELLSVTGPFGGTAPASTPSRQKVFVCTPATRADEPACARRIVSTLARRAYRRPAAASDLEMLMGFYEAGRSKGTFDAGVEMAVRRILASPEFVFRPETDPSTVAPGSIYRISDLELATRLSFFLWSSIPDEQLLTLAEQGRLKRPAVLEQQVRRMLADPKSKAIVDNFAGQWLYLRNLRSIAPSTEIYADFDDNLRQAFRTETEMFFQSVMREDRSVLDLLNGDYTFVNERLARHYGMRGIYGSHFRRVAVTDENRRGILGQGSVLTVTSLANRTSVVNRGKWVLSEIMGTPPPPPPPNVPALEENRAGARSRSLRERMEEHRKNPACATCHRVMDPIGFALEPFDAIGAWRKTDSGDPIDAAGQLADGTRVNGPASLRQALMARPEVFVKTFTEKMMIFALGRGVDHGDMPAVRAILRDAARNKYQFSSIVLGIVKSTPFQWRLKSISDSCLVIRE